MKQTNQNKSDIVFDLIIFITDFQNFKLTFQREKHTIILILIETKGKAINITIVTLQQATKTGMVASVY